MLTFDPVEGILLRTVWTVGGVQSAMSFDNLLLRETGLPFKTINILGVVTQKQALVGEESQEVMAWGWFVSFSIEFFDEGEEWLRVLTEVVNFENCCRVRQVVALQLVIQTDIRTAEIRYSGG